MIRPDEAQYNGNPHVEIESTNAWRNIFNNSLIWVHSILEILFGILQ